MLGGLCLLLISCAARRSHFGLIDEVEGVLELRSVNGATMKLLVDEGDPTLRLFLGKLVRVDGVRTRRGLRVEDVELDLGVSSLPAYIGTLKRVPQGLLLLNEEAGSGLLIDEAARPLMEPYVGQRVMVEGLVSPGRIDVLNWRVLDEHRR